MQSAAISPRRVLEAARRLKLRTDARWRFELPAWSAPTSQRVAVVGAGIAGLATARLLADLGHEVLLLEARERAGGRILTLREPFDDGLWAEAGAFRIADTHLATHYWARRLGLPLEPVYPDRGHVLRESPAGVIEANARWMSAHRFDQTMAGHSGSDDSHDGRGAAAVLRRFVRESLFQPTWSRIAGGMDRLPATLAHSLAQRIHYGCIVDAVEQDRHGVHLRYRQGDHECMQRVNRVVMAVPQTTLGDITFAPELGAAKHRAAATVPNADAIRFVFQLRDRRALGARRCGFAAGDDGVELWQPSTNRRTGRCLLLLYAQGSAAAQFTRLGSEARMRRALDRAQDLFPGIAAEVERAHEVCWSEDPWARGAQSRVDQAGIARSELGTQEGRIHFAGEYTTSNWIDGALRSAHRVVDEIARTADERAATPPAPEAAPATGAHVRSA